MSRPAVRANASALGRVWLAKATISNRSRICRSAGQCSLSMARPVPITPSRKARGVESVDTLADSSGGHSSGVAVSGDDTVTEMAVTSAYASGTTSLWKYVSSRRLNLLTVFLPIALVLRFVGANDVVVFVASALAVLPLAGLIGSATEEAAKYLGAGLGGFLNATFGNAAELIIVVLALQRGLTEVVKASLTGSILGNLLLVLGLAMLVGGWNREKQTFSRTHAGASAGMLVLAVVALLMPDIYAETVT